MIDPKQRFSDRADDYAKYRPDYPASLYELLRDRYGLMPEHTIVDLGAGTGLFARLFLERGHAVIGVEPNEAMLRAGELELANFPKYSCVRATAEETTLPDGCADLITAGTAFHWFDPVRTEAECLRLMKPHARVVLAWNVWDEAKSDFNLGYRSLIDTWGVSRVVPNSSEAGDFMGGRFDFHGLPHQQRFDFDGLLGRLMSASYAPKAGHPNHVPMIEALERLFDEHHDDEGFVTLELLTKVLVGWQATFLNSGR